MTKPRKSPGATWLVAMRVDSGLGLCPQGTVLQTDDGSAGVSDLWEARLKATGTGTHAQGLCSLQVRVADGKDPGSQPSCRHHHHRHHRLCVEAGLRSTGLTQERGSAQPPLAWGPVLLTRQEGHLVGSPTADTWC